MVPRAAELIGRHFEGWTVNVTGVTHESTVSALRASGINVTQANSENRLSVSPIEDDHLRALEGGITLADTKGSDAVAYIDGDRAFLAAIHYPGFIGEFAGTAALVTGARPGHVNVRRTAQDYLTHPYFDTEFEINRLCSKAFGGPVDVVSTTHMMHRETAGAILHQSGTDEPLDFPHLKWLVLGGKSGADLYSQEISGLPFETPYQVALRKEDDYPEVVAEYNRTLLIDPSYRAAVVNPSEQGLRHNTVVNYLTYLDHHLGDFSLSQEDAYTLRAQIGVSIESMERRKMATLEGVKRSLAETMHRVPPESRLWTPGAPPISSIYPSGERK